MYFLLFFAKINSILYSILSIESSLHLPGWESVTTMRSYLCCELFVWEYSPILIHIHISIYFTKFQHNISIWNVCKEGLQKFAQLLRGQVPLALTPLPPSPPSAHLGTKKPRFFLLFKSELLKRGRDITIDRRLYS